MSPVVPLRALWRGALATGIAASLLAIAWVIWAQPVLVGTDGWAIPADAWVGLPGAYYVAGGAFPYLYEANDAAWFGTFPYPPGLPLLLAPAAWLNRNRTLGESLLFTVPRPAMWPLLAGWATTIVTAGLAWAAAAFAVAGRRRILLAVTGAVGVYVGGLWGHWEDLVATAALLGALLAAGSSRWRAAAVWLGVALLFKQTALAAAPLLIGLWPAGRRLRLGALAAGVVGVPVALCVAALPSATLAGLVGAASTPSTGTPHPLLGLVADGDLVVGWPFRAAWVLACWVGGWWVARRHPGDPRVWLAALALMTLGRLALEPVAHGYYLGVAGLLVAAWASTQCEREWRLGLGLGLGLVAWGTPAAVGLPGGWWWAGLGCLAGAAAWRLVAVLRNPRGLRGVGREPGASTTGPSGQADGPLPQLDNRT